MKSSNGNGSASTPGMASFLPKPATPAGAIVPCRRTVVLPEVLVAGVAQLAVAFTTRVTRAYRMTVGLPPEFGPLNTSVQPVKFDGGAVDVLPLTAVAGDR